MKLKYFFAAALAVGMTTSWSDFLDQDNQSNVAASAFYNTQNGFESLTNSMYGSLRAIYKVSPLTLTAGTDLFALSCVRLCDPMNCSLPGSSVHGMLQARILEWVAFSRRSSQPRDQTQFYHIAGRILSRLALILQKGCCLFFQTSSELNPYLLITS